MALKTSPPKKPSTFSPSPLGRMLALAAIWVISLVLFAPMVDFQLFLSQGDHGRDLYCFTKALDGQLPYRDYWWVYGPLMPTYYSLFFKALGINITSILIGKYVLFLTGGLIIGALLSSFLRPAMAVLGAVWFYTFAEDFFFTYNHIGGIVILLAAALILVLYAQTQRENLLFRGLFLVFILCLIKINFGITCLLVFVASVWFIDILHKTPLTRPKKIFYILAFFVLPAVVLSIYLTLVRELPVYAIRQCLPYLTHDHPNTLPPLSALRSWLWALVFNVKANLPNMFFFAMLVIAVVYNIYMLLGRQLDSGQKRFRIAVLTILPVFYVMNAHEFIASGTLYRIFWAQPFSALLIFCLLGFATLNFSRFPRFALYATLSVILTISTTERITAVNHFKVPEHYLDLPRTHVYLQNSPGWIDTVTKTTHFLEQTIPPGETFFALPYDPLYYYLTGLDSPTRQLIFFEHINIPPEQELIIIQELQSKNINWVLVSSRARSTERGLGILGATYCPLLGRYIQDNFAPIAQFGDWTSPAGWATGHGTMILKRKNQKAGP